MSIDQAIEPLGPEVAGASVMRGRPSPALGRLPRPVSVIAPLLACGLVLGALAGSQVDLHAGGAHLAGSGKRLSAVRLVSEADGTPMILAEIARRSRGRLMIWRHEVSGAFSLALTQRLGELRPGNARIRVGSGHSSDGASPGTVRATSSMLPFELTEPMASLPAGSYSAELQLRSR